MYKTLMVAIIFIITLITSGSSNVLANRIVTYEELAEQLVIERLGEGVYDINYKPIGDECINVSCLDGDGEKYVWVFRIDESLNVVK